MPSHATAARQPWALPHRRQQRDRGRRRAVRRRRARRRHGIDDRVEADTVASKPLCSSFKNPNAGKLADKSTGQAKEHSASPVHEDCIPDSSASSATAGPSSSASASYGGLRDTTSNAQSNMPSTASSSSSGIYANRDADVNGSANTSQGTSSTQGTTPKMAGDSGTRQ